MAELGYTLDSYQAHPEDRRLKIIRAFAETKAWKKLVVDVMEECVGEVPGKLGLTLVRKVVGF